MLSTSSCNHQSYRIPSREDDSSNPLVQPPQLYGSYNPSLLALTATGLSNNVGVADDGDLPLSDAIFHQEQRRQRTLTILEAALNIIQSDDDDIFALDHPSNAGQSRGGNLRQ